MIRNHPNLAGKLCVIGVLCTILSSCVPKLYEISKNYNKNKYQRMALLVVRVGNDSPLGCPVPITVGTDYSIRKPELASEFNLITPGQYVAKTDVYIEDEARLRESLPSYPAYSGLRPFISGSWVAKYYKNITPQIYKTVSALLAKKGYQVVDVKEVSSAWPAKISEMKINAIVDALKKDADAVFIMHYADIGYYYYRVGSSFTGGSVFHQEGFAGLNYAVAIYDANTKDQLFSFWDAAYGFGQPKNLLAISSDPEIMNDPVLSKKVIVEGYSDGAVVRSRISLSFSEDEAIAFVMRYLTKGLHVKDKISWTGLDELIP